MPTDDNAPAIASGVPISYETGTMTENGPAAPIGQQSVPLFVPPEKRIAPIVDGAGTKNGDLAKALAAGKTCAQCRYFDYAEGQRRFTKERLGTAIVRELAWKPEWWNPADYGACGIARRDAVHKDATCEEWVPASRVVSFWRKLGGK